MPQSRGQPSQQGKQQCTPKSSPEQIRWLQHLADQLRTIDARRVANGAPRRSLQLRAQATQGYRFILFGEEGYVKALYSTFLSLPYQGIGVVATHPRWGRRPSTLTSSDNKSILCSSSIWSTEGSNYSTWQDFENEGSPDSNSLSIFTDAAYETIWQ